MSKKIKHFLKKFLRKIFVPIFKDDLNKIYSKLHEVDNFIFDISEDTEKHRENIDSFIKNTEKDKNDIKEFLIKQFELTKNIEEQTRNNQKNNENIEKAIQQLQKITTDNSKSSHLIAEAIEEYGNILSDTKTRMENLETHANQCSTEIENNTDFIRKISDYIGHNEEKHSLHSDMKETPEIDYLQFENTFRGDEELIKNRQKPYLKYFQDCTNVLDIGCGRGEFLELCKQNDIKAIGIDLDSNMFSYCQSKGLNVIHGNVFPYLNKQIQNTFDGIFSAQVIEHLDLKELQHLFFLLSKTMSKKSYMVLETVNPLCPIANQHFFTDLSHIRPIFPRVLRFIIENYGFKFETVILGTPIIENIPENNENMDQASNYGDYALIAQKI